MKQIKVAVVEFRDRTHYQMQWRAPKTRRTRTKSTRIERTGRKREYNEAVKVAAKFEAELRTGRYQEVTAISWEDFRERYFRERLSGLAKKSIERADGKIMVLPN